MTEGESMVNFGTCYFSTNLMRIGIYVEFGKVMFDDWLGFMPIRFRSTAETVCKRVEKYLDDLFPSGIPINQFIAMVQDQMKASPARLKANPFMPYVPGTHRR